MIILIQLDRAGPPEQKALQTVLDRSPLIRDWHRPLSASWLVETHEKLEDWQQLLALVHEALPGQSVLFTPVFRNYRWGYLPKDTWEWLRKKQNYAEVPKNDPKADKNNAKDSGDADNRAAAALHEITAAPALADFIGMDEPVAQLQRRIAGIAFRQAAQTAGLQLGDGFHNMLIAGPSGVGKTSLAKAAALLLKDNLPGKTKKQVYLVQAADLIDRHVGKSANNTKAVLERAAGGIVVFDEIDALLDVPHYGPEVLNTLNSHIGNAPNNPVIIGTLYGHREHEFRTANIGLSSRFPHTQQLTAYDDATLAAIFARKAEQAGLALAPAAADDVKRLFGQVRNARGRNFGNAREVDNIFHAAVDNLAERFAALRAALRDAFIGGADGEDAAAARAAIDTITLADIPLRDAQTGMLRRRPSVAGGSPDRDDDNRPDDFPPDNNPSGPGARGVVRRMTPRP